jgi:thiamine pyrophosphokinase
VIAADSGLELANRFSITPDCIVGDFDSLSDKRLLNKFRNADVKRFETAKDYTDTEIALEAARDAGADDIVLVGGGGGRLDHLVGILALFHRTLRPNRWITDRSIVQLITSEHEESGEVGRIVSFFPLSTGRSRMASHGLRWPLDELEWRLGDAGVSNEFIAPTISIAMKEGALLMIMPMQDCL